MKRSSDRQPDCLALAFRAHGLDQLLNAALRARNNQLAGRVPVRDQHEIMPRNLLAERLQRLFRQTTHRGHSSWLAILLLLHQTPAFADQRERLVKRDSSSR